MQHDRAIISPVIMFVIQLLCAALFYALLQEAVEIGQLGVVGELLLTVPIIGFEFNDVNINNEGKYWILELDDKKLTVAVPRKFEGAVEWEDDVWIAFFEAVE